MKSRLSVISVVVLVVFLAPRLWAQSTEAESVLKAREAALAAGDLDGYCACLPTMRLWCLRADAY